MREAGLALDRALAPLPVPVERLGPIGIVDLADRTDAARADSRSGLFSRPSRPFQTAAD